MGQSPPPGAGNPLLDPYRERAGTTRDPSGLTGVVFVSVEKWWSTSGHLWWRKQSDPEERPHLWMLMPGGAFDDYVLPGDHVASITQIWAEGRLGTFNGHELTVDWLDADESLRVKEEIMGL
jgi:hypothetical protein